MANIAIFRINYKSDFILTLNSDAGWMTPFCIKFWTGAPSQAYFVGYDGETYTHCAPVAGDPTKLEVQFDDHHLPIGDLKFQIGYHFTVADFPTTVEDEVINQAAVIIDQDGTPMQVMLDLNGETAPEIQFSLPAYANEAQRIANEEQRIAAEAIRIVNEESRIAAETIRQQNEAQRIAQETARVNEFATLKSQSQAATSAANTAAALANEKAALAADKAALAGAAATLANAKAQLAADKAALADDAAQLANDKASLAQQKAEYAKTQGGYAKDQGDYAKAQGDYAKEQGDTALADHQRAEADHGIAIDDHTQAGNDHTRAESDHGIAVDDHTQAGNDHTRAESDHGIAADDHTQAGNDHTRAESDHGIAADDHTQAGNDHTRAESDHTRAESDHAAVEVYVDSLGVFDLSKHNAVGGVLATYADLSAALTAINALESKYKYGGMSFKFVRSSDNKYQQFRLMSNSFSTAISDWQGVDEEPVFRSKNLAMSDGVITLTDNLTGLLDSIIDRTIEDKKQLTRGYTYIHCPIRKGNSYLISNSSDSAAIFAIVTSNDTSWTTVESLGQFDVSQSMIFIPTLDANYFAVYALGNSYITIKTIGSLAKTESSLVSVQKELLLPKLYNDYDSLENAGKLLKSSDGTLDTVANNKTSDYISVVGYDRIQYSELFPVVSGWCGLCLYDKNKTYIGTPMVSSDRDGEVNLANYPNAVFMRFSPYNFAVAFSVELSIDSESSVRTLSKRIDDIDAKISESYDIVISKNGGGDYTSLLEGIKNAVLKPHQKVLVKKGSYDIVQEFDAYYGEGALENNSTIFGIILENNVDITFEQEALVVYNYTGSNDFNLHEFSPFYVGTAGNGFTIRNLQLNASNCRYCIHDDSNLQSRAYTNSYLNCSLKLDNSGNNRGYRQCIGGGFGMNGNIIIDGCYFESVNASDDIVSWHNYRANNAHSQLRLYNSYFYGNTTFRLSWYGTSTLITRALVCGNSFGVDAIHRAENVSSLVENTELIKWNNEVRNS